MPDGKDTIIGYILKKKKKVILPYMTPALLPVTLLSRFARSDAGCDAGCSHVLFGLHL